MIPMTNAHLLLIPDLLGRHYDSMLNGYTGDRRIIRQNTTPTDI